MDNEKDTLQTLAADIAKEIGAPWAVELQREYYPTIYVCHPDGRKISVRIKWNKKTHISLSGALHIGRNGQYVQVYEGSKRFDVPTISVAIARGIPTICKEIGRRLLGKYTRIFEKAKARIAADEDYAGKRRANLTQLSAIVGGHEPKDDDTGHTSYYHNNGRGYGDIWCSPDSCNLKLSSLSIETARQVLEVVAGKVAL